MRRVVPFSKFGIPGLVLSILVTCTLLTITFINGGFNLGIDFKSGQTIDIALENTDVDRITNAIANEIPQVVVTRIGNDANETYNIKVSSTQDTQETDLTTVTRILNESFGGAEILSTSFIGTGISENLLQSVITLTLGALGLILLYVWLRFKLHFAISSILTLTHDILFIIGVVGAFKIEVSTSTVAAILTIVGYSLNDTIVIFDRIRENLLLIREGSFKEITNTSITRTLARTTITSLTTLLAVVALMIFATGDIYNFAKVLVIGVIEGTWSSIFLATPILTLIGEKKIMGSRKITVLNDDASSRRSGAPSLGHASSEKHSNVSDKELARMRAEALSKQARKKGKH